MGRAVTKPCQLAGIRANGENVGLSAFLRDHLEYNPLAVRRPGRKERVLIDAGEASQLATVGSDTVEFRSPFMLRSKNERVMHGQLGRSGQGGFGDGGGGWRCRWGDEGGGQGGWHGS